MTPPQPWKQALGSDVDEVDEPLELLLPRPPST
jgi:hypothetical protein